MKKTVLSAEKAAAILFGPQLAEPGFDPATAQFQSGADVCEALAAYFAFTHEDYLRIARHERARSWSS